MSPQEVIALAKARRLAASGEARAIREAAGLSVAELASAIPVKRTTLQRWESRQRVPRAGDAVLTWVDLLDKLA